MSLATLGCFGRVLFFPSHGGSWMPLCLQHQQLKAGLPLSPARRAAGGREGGSWQDIRHQRLPGLESYAALSV